MAGKRWLGTGMCHLYLMAATVVGTLACNPGTSHAKCDQVMQIAKALDGTECEYKRQYYDCLRLEGCYSLPDGCTRQGGTTISCAVACEDEPIFATCRDTSVASTPEEDFHLCPHIPKAAQSTPPPTENDFLGAPAVPFTLTCWSTWSREATSAVVGNVLPSLWQLALRTTFADIFGFNQLAIQLETPVTHRPYVIGFPDSDPLSGSEETTFMVVFVHVLSETAVSSTQSKLEAALIGSQFAPPTNLTDFEDRLRIALNASLPFGAGLTLTNLGMDVISGRIVQFPVLTTTMFTTTRTSVNPYLALRLYRTWRLRCRAGVVYRWEIDEVDFWVDGCPVDSGRERLDPLKENSTIAIITSGDLDNPCCLARYAFDGISRTAVSEGTAWVSACQACEAGSAYLGLDGGEDHNFRIGCVVLKQGEDVTSQCDDIVIEATNDPNMINWQIRGEMSGFGVDKLLCIARTREDYPNLECGMLDDGCRGLIDFGDCPGYQQVCTAANTCRCTTPATYANIRFRYYECGLGDDGCGGSLEFGACRGWNQSCVNNKCNDNRYRASMWRIVCETGTVGRWWLREVEFHLEGLCLTREAQFKEIVSTGGAYRDHAAAMAFDGNRDTLFMSQCLRCQPREAWIGLDFGRQITIACVKLVQHESTIHQCPKIVLEYSDDGFEWIERARYGFGQYSLTAEEDLTPDLDATQTDEDLRPPERLASWWRLLCYEKLSHSWGVREVEFFDDIDCQRSLKSGIKSIVHSRSSSWPAANAVDSRTETMWKTACGQCVEQGCEACSIGNAYIGMEFSTLVFVKCVKIHQLEIKDGGCSKVRLQFSTTGHDRDWQIRDTFKNVQSFAYLKPYQQGDDVNAARWSESMPFLLCLFLLGAVA